MVLLILLKTAGICALVLLTVLLIAVLLLLAVPFRYEISEKSQGKSLDGKLVFSWLWQGIRLRLDAKPEDALKGELKLFGYRYLRIYYRFSGKAEDAEAAVPAAAENDLSVSEESVTEQKEAGEQIQALNCLFDDEQEVLPEETGSGDAEHSGENGLPEDTTQEEGEDALQTGNRSETERTRDRLRKKRKEQKDRLEVFLQKCLKAIKDVFAKISARLKDDLDRLKNSSAGLSGKLKELFELLKKEENRASLTLMKQQLLRVLKELLPRSGRGDVAFGTGDPYQTGQILQGLALLYPFYGKTFEIAPVFEEKRLDTDITVTGKICLGVILICLIRTVLDKGVRRIVQETRRIIRES